MHIINSICLSFVFLTILLGAKKHDDMKHAGCGKKKKKIKSDGKARQKTIIIPNYFSLLITDVLKLYLCILTLITFSSSTASSYYI